LVIPDHHLVLDAGYPLMDWGLTPVSRLRRDLSESEASYNYHLSSARVTIERAFGQLKGRWRRLQLLDCALERAASWVSACAVLHNVCLTANDRLKDVFDEDEDKVDSVPPAGSASRPSAKTKRAKLIAEASTWRRKPAGRSA
jgi:hypothetical protein